MLKLLHQHCCPWDMKHDFYQIFVIWFIQIFDDESTQEMDIPELLLKVLLDLQQDKFSLSRCSRINKVWRETIIENAQEFLESDVYAHCQATVVSADCIGGSADFEFLIPSIDAQLLIITGGLQVNRDKREGISLSFVSARVAEKWFRYARRFVDKAKHLQPSQLSKISPVAVRGTIMPPVVRLKTGQLFFWTHETFMYGAPSIEEFTKQVRSALKSKDPTVVIGGRTIRLIGFDGRDRLWFRYGDQSTVYAIGADEVVTFKAKSSTEAGLTLPQERSGHFHVTGDGRTLFERLSVLDKQGRFFFGDGFGVHVIHPDAPEHFEYQPIYKVNYELNNVSSSPNFCPIVQMTCDKAGKVFVWTSQGYSDRTIGYWCYADGKWTHVHQVPVVSDMFVSVIGDRREIWVSSNKQTYLLEEPLDGSKAPKHTVLGDVYFPPFKIFARSADHSAAVLCFPEKSFLMVSDDREHRGELPNTVHQMIKPLTRSNLYEKSNNTVKDGVIYFAEENRIASISVAGVVEPYYCTETTNTFTLGVMYVGTRTMELSRRKVPLIYMRDGNVLDTGVKFVNRDGIPGMRLVRQAHPSYPSPSGGVYVKQSYWDGVNFPKSSGIDIAFCDTFIYGKEGAHIIGHKDKGCTLHYKGEKFQAADMCELADKYYDMLVEVLPYPPIPSYADSYNIVHDGLGNLWCLNSTKAGVRTREKLLLVDTTVHKSKDHDWVTMYKIAPLGDGTAVVLSVYYKSMLLSVQHGSLIVGDTSVQIPVTRLPGGASFFRQSAFYAKSGEVYIVCDDCTYECKSGKVFRGELCLIDRHGGKWFAKQSGIIYVYNNQEYSGSINLRRLSADEDFGLDHSAWVQTQKGLTRLQFNGQKLLVVEELNTAVDPWGQCTAKGARNVFWIKEASGKSGTTCLVLDEKYMQ